MITLEELDKYKDASIYDIDINDLDNIDEIDIDDSKNVEDRIMDFLNETKNPYFFNINGFIVKFTYKEDGLSADECVTNAMKHII